MAEMALGLTKTAVQGTLNRVKSAIEEEGKLRVRVQDDLVFISGEFRMMQSFLKASNTGGRASQDEVVQEWVRQLRDLAFDVEDCVEFVVHLDKASPWDWVRRLASTIPCVARPPLPLDVAVAEIKRLKVRVEDLSQRNTRYNLFSTSGGGGGGGSSSDQQQLMHLPGCTTSSTPATTGAFHAVREVWEAMGKLIPTNGKLKRLIDCEGSELKVISLWRSPQADVVGELGWVTIAKKIYDDPEICQEFKNRAWVKLSTHHPFNPIEFLNKLLSHFTASHPNLHHRCNDDISELMLQVSQHRYLIVLETELSSVADWDAIRICLLDGKNGSRIIVSTKHLGIALVCTGEPYEVSELKHFSNDRYLCAIFPKGCWHRIGMGEFFWQLRRSCGVISLLCRNYDEQRQIIDKLYNDDDRTFNLVDGVKFEHQCYVDATGNGLVESARIILALSYPEDEQQKVYEQLSWVTDGEFIFRRCRELLNEHDCLFFIKNLKSIEDWNLFKKHLSCESTRGCTVVVTCEESVARHCVDHNPYRVLNVRDLLKGSDQVDDSQCSDGESSTGEEGESELEPLVGREGEEEMDFFDELYTGRTWSVWGIAGVGKSALVRKYYKRIMSGRKKIKYGWVDVPHPFNLADLCQRLLLDLYSDGLDAKEAVAIGMMEGQDPIQGCCKFLRENKCLLVFDGLQSTHHWDLIKNILLSQPIWCTPIVITRDKRVAEHCCENNHGLNVNGLEPEAALELFTKVVLDKDPLFTEVKPISELILPKCGGLPEVIRAIGQQIPLGAHMQAGVFPMSLEHLNYDFMGTLQNLKVYPSLGGLFCWMQSYFDACSDELKPCIFYILVFPADQSIRWKRLLRRWIAEGYLSAGTANERGENLMSELFGLSILHFEEEISDLFKLNGFFREYIKSRPMEDNRVFELDGSCSPSPRLTGQHLSIRCSWDRDEIVFRSLDLSRLRSFTVSGDWRSFLICDKMKLLRVLDLEGTSTSDGTTSVTDEDLEQIGKLLPRLKFMSLRGCRLITRLPDSLGDMKQLQTLDAKDTSIVELPPAIVTKLHKLQYFRVGTTETRPLLVATTPEQTPSPPPPPPPQEDGNDGTCRFPRAKAALSGVVQGASTGARKMANDLEETCSRLWHFKNLRRRRRVAKNGGGVEVVPAAAKGIGKLTELHTLGVVNVAGGTCASLFFKELKKLTQLRKLRLSGITRENWSSCCDAMSGHRHLESLSLKLLLLEEGGNYDFACFDGISKPPKTLKSIKVLYTTEPGAGAGGAWIRPTWIKQLRDSCIDNFHHELTISSQEDMDIILYKRIQVSETRLRVKPTEQHLSADVKLNYQYNRRTVDALRIDCGSINSTVTFGGLGTIQFNELNIRCCGSCELSSCLRIVGLNHIRTLEKVLVTGPCSNDFKEDLRKQLEGHPNEPKVFPL